MNLVRTPLNDMNRKRVVQRSRKFRMCRLPRVIWAKSAGCLFSFRDIQNYQLSRYDREKYMKVPYNVDPRIRETCDQDDTSEDNQDLLASINNFVSPAGTLLWLGRIAHVL